MASSLALRVLQRNCAQTISKVSNQGKNVFFQRIPLSTLASFTAFQKYNQNSSLSVQKNTPLHCVVRTSSTSPEKTHDHVMLWTAEKALSVVMLGAIPAAIFFNSTPTEFFLALCITVHAHWGLEAIVVDYIRPSVFGKVIPKLSLAALYGLSALTLGGLCYFIYTDVGLVNAVKLLWKL